MASDKYLYICYKTVRSQPAERYAPPASAKVSRMLAGGQEKHVRVRKKGRIEAELNVQVCGSIEEKKTVIVYFEDVARVLQEESVKCSSQGLRFTDALGSAILRPKRPNNNHHPSHRGQYVARVILR